ncbi:MAG: DUF2157 domain-containing protein [Thiohalophilus sp.]
MITYNNFMSSDYHTLVELIEQGKIPPGKVEQAVAVAGITPLKQSWRNFIDLLLLWLGSLSLVFSVMFFIAYNWDDIGRFAKFGMVEVLIVLAVLGYWKLGERRVVGQVSLVAATIFLGVLLALYGQTYQTGADPWQLFMNWALLSLPWVLVGRFSVLWIVWLALVNLSIILYFRAFPAGFGLLFHWGTGMLWGLFLLNILAQALWELAARRWTWLDQRWAVRLIAVVAGYAITWLTMMAIFDWEDVTPVAGFMWLIWIVAMVYIYQFLIRDLFMLTGCCLSAIIVVTSFLSKHLLMQAEATGALLIMAFLVIGMGAVSIIWLKKVHHRWQA